MYCVMGKNQGLVPSEPTSRGAFRKGTYDLLEATANNPSAPAS